MDTVAAGSGSIASAIIQMAKSSRWPRNEKVRSIMIFIVTVLVTFLIGVLEAPGDSTAKIASGLTATGAALASHNGAGMVPVPSTGLSLKDWLDQANLIDRVWDFFKNLRSPRK